MKNIIKVLMFLIVLIAIIGCEEKSIDSTSHTIDSAKDTISIDKGVVIKDDSTVSKAEDSSITNIDNSATPKVENINNVDIGNSANITTPQAEDNGETNINSSATPKAEDNNNMDMNNSADSTTPQAEDNSSEDTKLKKIQISQKGWYIRLKARSDTLVDDKAVFGYLQGASDRRDRYDSPAYASSGLYVVIYNSSFGAKKEYRSDYRAFKPSGSTKESWVLRVYNRRGVDDNITLSWDGITLVQKREDNGFDEEHKSDSTELQNMRLVDADEGSIVNVLEDHSYSFNMNGKKVRELKWIMLADGDDEPEIQ